MKRHRPIVFNHVVQQVMTFSGTTSSLHAPLWDGLARSMDTVAVEGRLRRSAVVSTLALQGIRSRPYAIEALLYDTCAVLNDSPTESEAVQADDLAAAAGDNRDDSLNGTGEQLVDVPDPLPPDEE